MTNDLILKLVFGMLGLGVGATLGTWMQARYQFRNAPEILTMTLGFLAFMFASHLAALLTLLVVCLLPLLAYRYRRLWTGSFAPLLRLLRAFIPKPRSARVDVQLATLQEAYHEKVEALLAQQLPPDVKQSLLELVEHDYQNSLQQLLSP